MNIFSHFFLGTWTTQIMDPKSMAKEDWLLPGSQTSASGCGDLALYIFAVDCIYILHFQGQHSNLKDFYFSICAIIESSEGIYYSVSHFFNLWLRLVNSMSTRPLPHLLYFRVFVQRQLFCEVTWQWIDETFCKYMVVLRENFLVRKENLT